MKCPACGELELVLETRDIPYFDQGKLYTLKAITGHVCKACDEFVLYPEETEKYQKAIEAIHTVDA